MEYRCDKTKEANQKDIDNMISIYLDSMSFEEFLINVDLKIQHPTWNKKLPFKVYWFKRSHPTLARFIACLNLFAMGCSSMSIVYLLAIKPASSYSSITSFFFQIFGNMLLCVCSIIFEYVWKNGAIARKIMHEENLQKHSV